MTTKQKLDVGGRSHFKGVAHFASGEKCPNRLADDYWKMREKVGKEGRSYALVEIGGKVAIVPISSAEAALDALCKQLGGEFHGLIICMR